MAVTPDPSAQITRRGFLGSSSLGIAGLAFSGSPSAAQERTHPLATSIDRIKALEAIKNCFLEKHDDNPTLNYLYQMRTAAPQLRALLTRLQEVNSSQSKDLPPEQRISPAEIRQISIIGFSDLNKGTHVKSLPKGEKELGIQFIEDTLGIYQIAFESAAKDHRGNLHVKTSCESIYTDVNTCTSYDEYQIHRKAAEVITHGILDQKNSVIDRNYVIKDQATYSSHLFSSIPLAVNFYACEHYLEAIEEGLTSSVTAIAGHEISRTARLEDASSLLLAFSRNQTALLSGDIILPEQKDELRKWIQEVGSPRITCCLMTLNEDYPQSIESSFGAPPRTRHMRISEAFDFLHKLHQVFEQVQESHLITQEDKQSLLTGVHTQYATPLYERLLSLGTEYVSTNSVEPTTIEETVERLSEVVQFVTAFGKGVAHSSKAGIFTEEQTSALYTVLESELLDDACQIMEQDLLSIRDSLDNDPNLRINTLSTIAPLFADLHHFVLRREGSSTTAQAFFDSTTEPFFVNQLDQMFFKEVESKEPERDISHAAVVYSHIDHLISSDRLDLLQQAIEQRLASKDISSESKRDTYRILSRASLSTDLHTRLSGLLLSQLPMSYEDESIVVKGMVPLGASLLLQSDFIGNNLTHAKTANEAVSDFVNTLNDATSIFTTPNSTERQPTNILEEIAYIARHGKFHRSEMNDACTQIELQQARYQAIRFLSELIIHLHPSLRGFVHSNEKEIQLYDSWGLSHIPLTRAAQNTLKESMHALETFGRTLLDAVAPLEGEQLSGKRLTGTVNCLTTLGFYMHDMQTAGEPVLELLTELGHNGKSASFQERHHTNLHGDRFFNGLDLWSMSRYQSLPEELTGRDAERKHEEIEEPARHLAEAGARRIALQLALGAHNSSVERYNSDRILPEQITTHRAATTAAYDVLDEFGFFDSTPLSYPRRLIDPVSKQYLSALKTAIEVAKEEELQAIKELLLELHNDRVPFESDDYQNENGTPSPTSYDNILLNRVQIFNEPAIYGSIERLSTDEITITDAGGIEHTVAREEVIEIAFSTLPKIDRNEYPAELFLHDGTSLIGKQFRGGEKGLLFDTTSGSTLHCDQSAVSAVLFQTLNEEQQIKFQTLQREERNSDEVLVLSDGHLRSLEAVVTSLGEDTVTLQIERDGEIIEPEVPLENLAGILYSPHRGRTSGMKPVATIKYAEGTEQVSRLQIHDGKAIITGTHSRGFREVPISEIQEIDFSAGLGQSLQSTRKSTVYYNPLHHLTRALTRDDIENLSYDHEVTQMVLTTLGRPARELRDGTLSARTFLPGSQVEYRVPTIPNDSTRYTKLQLQLRIHQQDQSLRNQLRIQVIGKSIQTGEQRLLKQQTIPAAERDIHLSTELKDYSHITLAVLSGGPEAFGCQLEVQGTFLP